MNAIGIDMPLLSTEGYSNKKLKEEGLQSFKQVLDGQQKDNMSEGTNLNQLKAKEIPEKIRVILNELSDSIELDNVQLEEMNQLIAFLDNTLVVKETLENRLIGNESSMQGSLTGNIPFKSGDTSLGKGSENLSLISFVHNPIDTKRRMDLNHKVINDPSTMNLFRNIISKFESLFSQMSTREDMQNATPKILELLHQWTAVEKTSVQSSELTNLVESLQKENSKAQSVWKDLVQLFQKRNQLSEKQLYNTDAKVSNKDVTNWLEKIFENQRIGFTDRVSLDIHSGTALSKLEQYAIHINQTQNSQPANQQLLEQFQSIMKTSKFLTLPNGTNQLSITLNPNNLGDMMVRLTQINGEMTVKIMVTTQAAKEMLEGNIHQLKNMFSPQQVVIEKQDFNSQHNQTLQREQNGQQWKEDDNRENSSDSDQEHNQSKDNDFEAQIRELLMNEKV